MKKNIFSDKETGKSSKGFYAALGISALMIGSACFFAYNEGEKLKEDNLTAENKSSISEEAVDKKYTDIPKLTYAAVTTARTSTTTVRTTTAVPATTAHIATLPAAGISVAEPPEEDSASAAAVTEAAQTAADKLANVSLPLADISNVITPFSGTELVKNETTGSWQTHNGTDIAAEVGAEVYAISPGEVSAVNDDPLWGTTVVIDHHNGYISKYCSLAKELSVQVGDTLASGDVIGVIGETADIESALAPHLHIEITHNGRYQDPMNLLQS
ncbi:MAG: M23 family metallopeptidase [Ruminococcus sp.]|nr:M23 family metallopeptidase [Ruminococcus sp.]